MTHIDPFDHFSHSDMAVLAADADPVAARDIDIAGLAAVVQTLRANRGRWVRVSGDLRSALLRCRTYPEFRGDRWPLQGCDNRVGVNGDEFLRLPARSLLDQLIAPDPVRLDLQENPDQ